MKKIVALLTTIMFLCGMMNGCKASVTEETIVNSGFLQKTQTDEKAEANKDSENQPVLKDNRDSEVFCGDVRLASKTVLALHITINPDFVVFSDASGLIIAQQPLNEDAEKLLFTANVTGKPVEEGITELLSTAYEQGFLTKDAAEIQIVPSVHNGLNWTEELEAALNQIITAFETEKNLQIVFTVKQPEITETVGDFAQQAGAVSVKEWTDISTGDHYTVYYNEEGKPVRSTVKEKDGDIGEFSINPENEQTSSVLWVHPDGSYVNNIYNDSGVLTAMISLDVAGNYGETIFSIDGNPVTAMNRYADGRQSDIQYYENGKYKFILTVYPDGSIQEDSYNEKGIRTLTITKKSDGSYSETTYYASGMQAKHVAWEANGYYSEIEYYDSANGTVNSNGNFKRYVIEGKNRYTEEQYREDGSVSYRLSKDTDSMQETTIDEKGFQYRKSQYFSGDITYSESQVDASGNMIYTKDTDKDGNVVECWYSNGEVTKVNQNGEQVFPS